MQLVKCSLLQDAIEFLTLNFRRGAAISVGFMIEHLD
jgi:hypothetical protein